MKRYIFSILSLALLLGLSACHTTEANFKASYDMALQKQKEGIGEDTYNKIQAEKNKNNEVVNGDSVRIVASYANVIDDKPSVASRYGVVVAEFKQMFNAQSYRDRLKTEEGYPSYVLYSNREQQYCVIVKGFEDKTVAAAFLKDIKRHVKIKILVEHPWILEMIY
jgi:hypothetical protein